ncbi:MAG TPA: hypothetical protein VFF06_34990 [Polyangia bacterium]|nr:hypothetical protein [Polyangia bacterium]
MSALLSGCLGAYSPLNGSGDDGGAGADLGVDVNALFNANVAPILTASCGACHAKTGGVGPGFMDPKPDMLTTILAYPGLIGATPETSRIYAKGQHEGPALTPAQAPVIADWINTWNAHQPAGAGDAGTVKPQIMPFKPVMGPNTVELAMLDSALAGQSITFTARMVGTSLELSSITVITPKSSGLHVVHPLWVTWDQHYNATPDPIDSFSNLDETVPASSTTPLGPGTLILPNFQSGFMVNVVFNLIEAKAVAVPDGGTVAGGGCKNVAGFIASAKPTLSGVCANCHAQNGNSAAGAFSLLTINQAGGDAQACASTLGEIDTTTPANSRIYTYTDPASGIAHPYKFQQKSSFADNWITTEQ